MASDLPIACTFSEGMLRAERGSLLPGLAERAAILEMTPSGARWRFDANEDVLLAIATTINAERRCCKFLTFALTAEPDGGPITLDITGPAGTRDFLDALLNDR